MNAIATNYYLSQLLPYDTDTKMKGDLKTCFKEYKLLQVALVKAIQAWNKEEFEKFDSVVGTNACQIVAAKIALLASQHFIFAPQIENQLSQAQRSMESLLPSLELWMKKGVPLKKLLADGLDVALTADELFMIQAYLLCVAKVVKPPKIDAPLNRNDAADPKKLKMFGDVSSKFTENLVKKLRQTFSAASASFVFERAQALNDPQLVKMLGKDFSINYNSWTCIPMFWTYKTLLRIVHERGIPIVFYAKFQDEDVFYSKFRSDDKFLGYRTVDKEYLFFQPSNYARGYSYQNVVPCQNDLEKVAVIVQGVVCASPDGFPKKEDWKSTMNECNMDIILSGAADHRQYPDVNEDQRIEVLQDEEYQKYKIYAQNEGYSLSNPTKFFIQHVYAAKVNSFEPFIKTATPKASIIRTFIPRDIIHNLNGEE